jgi:hypothetical protein
VTPASLALSLTATALRENRAAAALARAAGFSVIARAGTQTEYELRLSALAERCRQVGAAPAGAREATGSG